MRLSPVEESIIFPSFPTESVSLPAFKPATPTEQITTPIFPLEKHKVTPPHIVETPPIPPTIIESKPTDPAMSWCSSTPETIIFK